MSSLTSVESPRSSPEPDYEDIFTMNKLQRQLSLEARETQTMKHLGGDPYDTELFPLELE
jgi:hypothetical protein